jgi:hypothetical protein
MSNSLIAFLGAALILASAKPATAFCGFYVAKADAKIFNRSSQVVIARADDRTVLTISNDFNGPLTEFAEVVPVPTVLQKDQIHVGDRKLLERIDAYSAPRLVEYYDPDPCAPVPPADELSASAAMKEEMDDADKTERAKSLGVKIEAEYTVGEYDIVILSAKESNGLETWLRSEGYHLPQKAADALQPYVRQNMKFFVARVNLKEQAKTGYTYLRPIQIAYESPKFMLPIQLGMANADGPQDLTIYTLTPHGRVESTNYRTVEMPTGMDVPTFVKDRFADFYRSAYERAWRREEQRAVFTEYAWNGGFCDPCADNPLSADELRGLGVFWTDDPSGAHRQFFGSAPIVTRLHVRYDRAHFPEDLVFQETGNQENYQARYVLRYPFKGELFCSAGEEYLRSLDDRHRKEATALAELTGWELPFIYDRMGSDAPGQGPPPQPWYRKLWKQR